LIGVIAKPDQVGVVKEFFELFKTPWEFYLPGRVYDIVVATTDEIHGVSGRLVVAYGPKKKDIDTEGGVTAGIRRRGAILNCQEIAIPIYGDLLTFAPTGNATILLKTDTEAGAIGWDLPDSALIRVGYDLFEEVRFLLSSGQSLENAHLPTLELHIQILREWMVGAGVSFLEIMPAPAAHSFCVCLTHDIDFIGIRQHRFDHSMWGFVYRATFGALRNLATGRISLAQVVKSWLAAASLPFVYAGWLKDFWEPFGWYLEAENGLPATYFLVPFKGRAGDRVPGRHASRRATMYDAADLPDWSAVLLKNGCEIGVHGIDAWHSPEKGRAELAAISNVTGTSRTGVRMHWLLSDASTATVLEQAGYAYDSTVGYNETVGYRAGTGQVFRPLDTKSLLELPLHIQDGALFYPQKLHLRESEAEKRCQAIVEKAIKFGGVVTVLWHDRSHGPERFWGNFYKRLIHALKAHKPWFGTAGQIVDWFGQRRRVSFESVDSVNGVRTRLRYEGETIEPPLKVRVYSSDRKCNQGVAKEGMRYVDLSWNGNSTTEVELELASRRSEITC
jgi:peptidoglycan/xylan/chitin deacetylase (PgdA/CDA1 family)